MRSLLIAPADGKRLAEAWTCGADALIVDLAGHESRGRNSARAEAARFLGEARAKLGGAALIVKASALDSGETDADLDAVMRAAPDAILLPRSLGGASVQQLSTKLAVREAGLALADGSTHIIAVADTARGLLGMASYRGASARLVGLAWDANSLRADLGAEIIRDSDGRLASPYRLARDLTVFAATAAGVTAIDAPFPDADDLDGLRAEALAARRDGFHAKFAIDPAQVSLINEALGPAPGDRRESGGFRPIERTNP